MLEADLSAAHVLAALTPNSRRISSLLHARSSYPIERFVTRALLKRIAIKERRETSFGMSWPPGRLIPQNICIKFIPR